jgi:dTDP-4-dehydrorhamnose 3,5-epimerase
MLKITKTYIENLIIIEPNVFEDSRGYFFEGFSEVKYKEIGIEQKFVQDNFSLSSYGTIRGLHYQVGEFAQGKLCQVLEGKVLDVAVDIRFNSPTFGKSVIVELSSENKRQFWIPPGFAHGFSVQSEKALFHYKCTNYYEKNSERCIIYNDSNLSINWNVLKPIISNKDKLGCKFFEIEKDFKI